MCKKGTMPASDGFDIDFYARHAKLLVPHLQGLFREILERGDLTEAMKEATVSVLYKGRGKDKEDITSYRPVSITDTAYRILTKAIKIKMQKAVEAVIGDTNVAYCSDGRQMHDNTLSMTEVARRLRLEEGDARGVIVQADNTAAFDRCRWDFIHKIIETMGFPPEFQSVIRTLYTDLSFRIKLNGQVGDRMTQRNGVRQGCGCSPLVYVLQQEALMIAIREDPELEGVAYTSRGGDWFDKQVRERAMSDDTVVYLAGEEYLPRLFQLFDIHGIVTGQQMNRSKSCIITFDGEEGEEGEELERVRFGQEDRSGPGDSARNGGAGDGAMGKTT